METIQCKNCGDIMNRKTGVKNGKPWAGYFCQNRECKAVEWENSKPAFQPKVYTAKSQQPNWDAITANREENMRFLNSLNNAATVLSGAIQAGMSLEEAMQNYEKIAQKIYELGNPSNETK